MAVDDKKPWPERLWRIFNRVVSGDDKFHVTDDTANVISSNIARDSYSDASHLLGANEAFTSGVDEVRDYASIGVMFRVDVDSATNGAQLQFSHDKTNWTRIKPVTITASSFGAFAELPPEARYFRIVYTNGADAQSIFVVQVVYRRVTLTGPDALIGQTLDNNTLAAVSKAVISAQKASGAIQTVNLTDTGNLSVSIDEQTAEVALSALGTWSNNGGAVGTTAVQIVTAPPTGRKTVAIKSHPANSGTVHVGNSDAVGTGDGFPLASGETVELDLTENANDVWAIADAADQKVYWLQIAD